MTTLLVKNIHTLVTMEAEIRNAACLVRDNVIEQVGNTAELPRLLMKSWTCGRYVCSRFDQHTPFFQTLTRVIRCKKLRFIQLAKPFIQFGQILLQRGLCQSDGSCRIDSIRLYHC